MQELSRFIVAMTYVPKVGDRVDTHSKGSADADHAGVYTDWTWFPGKITKVKKIPTCEHMIVCIDELTAMNNACLGDQNRNTIKTSILV